MLTLTNAIVVPNITRMRVKDYQVLGDEKAVVVVVEVGRADIAEGEYMLVVRNNLCDRLVAVANPTSYKRLMAKEENVVTSWSTAFDDCSTPSGANDGARRRSLETLLKDNGCLPAGTVS